MLNDKVRVGMRVRVTRLSDRHVHKHKDLTPYLKWWIKPRHLASRKVGVTGTVASFLNDGFTKDVFYIRDDQNKTGVYSSDEFEPIKSRHLTVRAPRKK